MQPPFMQKVSMLVVLVTIIIFCCLMTYNISSNRILATRSYEESIKNLILNKFNNRSNTYNQQRNNSIQKLPSITTTQASSPPPPSITSSSTTTTINPLFENRKSKFKIKSEVPGDVLTEDNDDESMSYIQSQRSLVSSEKSSLSSSLLQSSKYPEDIKRKFLSLLSNKLKIQRRQQQNRPPSPSYFSSSSKRNFMFNNNDEQQPLISLPLSSSTSFLKQIDPQYSVTSFFDNPLSPINDSSFDWSSTFNQNNDDDDGGSDEDNINDANESISSSSTFDFDTTSFTTFSPSSSFLETFSDPLTSPLPSTPMSLPRPSLNLSSSSQKIAQLFRELTNQLDGSDRRHSKNNMNENDSNYYNKLHSQKNDSCRNDGVIITISTNYEISSPNYPNRYPPNKHCIWHIQSQKNQLLKVQIFKLHIEHDRACRFDRLDIKGVHQVDRKNGKTFIRTKRFCGHYLKGSEFDIGANHTTIEFHSDLYNEYPGFHLRIIAQSQDCTNELFVHNYSYITSPNYPESYEDSKNCWTWVHTYKDHRLLVNFEDLYLESGMHCEFDYVEIFDSSKALSSKSLGKFCTYPPSSKLYIYSTKNSLLFHFESDNFLALRGYKAKIVALRNDINISSYMDCNWNADWQNMTISSPLYPEPYPTGSRCETSITAPSSNERIILLFDWIDLVNENDDDYNSDEELVDDQTPEQQILYRIKGRKKQHERFNHRLNCSLDRLELYETLNDTEPSNVFCGFQSQPFRYVSQTDSIRLVFRSVQQKSTNNYRDRSRSHTTTSNPVINSYGILNPGFRAKFTFMTLDRSSNSTNAIASNKSNFETDQYRTSSTSPKSSSQQSNELSPLGNLGATSASNDVLVLIHRPENASIRLGSSHILYCEVKTLIKNLSVGEDEYSESSLPIIWFKGDREIHDGVFSNGSSLMIRQFTSKSVGRYICVYGDNSSDAWLTLKPDTSKCSASNVLFRERPRDQFTSEGEFVMLHCSATLADSQQDVEISWQRIPLVHHHPVHGPNQSSIKAQPVIYNSRIKKLSRGDLLFDRVLVEDSGYYFCVVQLDQKHQHHSRSLTSNNNDDNDDDDCVLKSVARVQINRRVDVRDFCGRISLNRNDNPDTMGDVGKIIGGTEAQPREFPWMVMFWDEKRHVFCGGALLNERWVVTAAHCFTDIVDESTVYVKLGKYDQTETEPTEIVTKIQHTIKHPHFSNETFDNDIALVKLTTHIQFTDNIRPICLATSTEEVRQMNSYFFSKDHPYGDENENEDSDDDIETAKFGFVTGWGRLKENGPLPRYLHKIRLPIVDHIKCRQSTTFQVTDNMFCAGYGKEIVGDACKGDSGGPLVVKFHSRWTLLGIVSWGEGCGRPEKYGYYTRVNNYDNWIRRLTAIH